MSTFPSKTLNRSTDSVSWGQASEPACASETTAQGSILQEPKIFEDEKTYFSRLPYFQACLFATVLEDVIRQLRILDACNIELKLSKMRSEMTMLLADKYGVEKKTLGLDVIDDIDPKKLHSIKYKLDKLQADKEFLMQVMTETYQNLCIEREFVSLADSVDQTVKKNIRLYHLAEEERKNKMLRRELHRQLRQLRNHCKSVGYESNREIELLRSQVEDAELTAGTRSRYVEGWQRSRAEQQSQTIYDKEKIPMQTIEQTKQKLEQEQRIHTEIEFLITIQTNEILEKVEQTMAKFEIDMESMDLKIQLMKNHYEDMLEKNRHYEETLIEHAEAIENWVAFKDKREAARKYQETMTNSAITVQAWWRGLLVRNQLGPYKPVKRKPQPKPDGKSKKKK